MHNTHDEKYEAAWENGDYGASEEFVQKAANEIERNLDDKLGLQIISIRLQKDLIEKLKILAKESGLGYQPFIRLLLTKYVCEQSEKSNIFSEIQNDKSKDINYIIEKSKF
ncbi:MULTISPECIES: CopG family antitoxin [Legionella]|uniref:BrnA antitoxin family protein n=2 Tax=Legionella TaxID=445 RepID=A0A9X2IDI6_9GAMM|nr:MULTISPECIES: CopG family antitoxin [Legionella]KTD12441.1 hypothetical protein Lhac_1312 [Legionella hackeliae]MCL9684818.1 BrnA antitoxin family protein [Legionella maioricensis]MCL9687780.1 BrnA antitoxin family protein [Legionella maioricensis]CEK11854.1 conserved protein of unknown function [Legionella hackeliae]STX48619.1 Uncharacterized protein conserved in bacteria [Legionella hackeliae]